MTDPCYTTRFRTDLIQRIAAQERVPQGQPLQISPWLAMSMLQKAVRRGRVDLAMNAAATLLRDSPDRLWRRLGGIAFEDIGLGSLHTVGLTVAALTGKRFRAAIGGDWAVASVVVRALAEAPKSRATDDLFMALETLPALADIRYGLAAETNSRLRQIALNTPNLHRRALAVLFLLGTNRPGGKLPARRGEVTLAFDLLDELGTAPTTLAICRDGYRKTSEALPALLALLALENGLRSGVTDDPVPPEVMIGGVPGWSLDMFTREGKLALTRLLATRAGVAELTRSEVLQARRISFLGQILFRVEGGLLARRVGGDLSDRLHSQLMFETLGVLPEVAVEALNLMREDLPLLNHIRAHVMKEARDV
ncbi:MgsA AAA+ ATPase C terminal [Loktanella salsilacus]|uniref:MgsA AAA+ ATPase C terminal n=1 Tax=Loktanella salsilacus TaxID=195913 RepID=A0A1I4I480_9RHOB|nr:hypothetical protein [Loktanella salsilacus]SFL48621.1 MgsA AAA+ ATPase C terminal [Loktanella salsilacus]